jgi:hypothetical protein
MPVAGALADFRAAVSQCDSLIANAHKVDGTGSSIFPSLDREQVTIAAFLNMFIAWESFLEDTIAHFMSGAPTISGSMPVKYVSPSSYSAAKAMVIGTYRYFDYANHDNVKKLVCIYFENGYPFEPCISGVFSDLADLRTLRNSSAHMSSSTQVALETLALRIFGAPQAGISLYQLLTATDPRSHVGETVFLTYKNKLIVTAELIANG